MNKEELSKLIADTVSAEITKYKAEVIQPLILQLQQLEAKQKLAIETMLKPVNADMLEMGQQIKRAYDHLAVGKGTTTSRVRLGEEEIRPSPAELRQFSQARINMASLSEVVETTEAK